jgi:hypothetical protein
MESDFRYYTRRAAEERRRAMHAVTEAARERHLELAQSFAFKAAQFPDDRQTITIPLVRAA